MSKQSHKTGLGKGLSALLNDSPEPRSQPTMSASATTPGNIASVAIAHIETNPYQPRTEFEQEALEALSDSIKKQGLIQPITVRKVGDSRYQLISGERRLRASTLAQLTHIPAYIRTANDQQMLEMALIENIQRENLNAIEIALSFRRMIDECNLKQEELGERVSKDRSTVTNYLRLLKLPPSIQAAIRDQRISMGHARALINLEEVDKQLAIFNDILKHDLSVRKVEEWVRNLRHRQPDKKHIPRTNHDIYVQKMSEQLTSKVGNKVAIKMQSNGRGVIEIPFLSADDLARIFDIIGHA